MKQLGSCDETKREPAASLHLGDWLQHAAGQQAVEVLAGLHPDAAVFAVDENRNVRLWNRGAQQLLGYEASDVLGNHCLKVSRCKNCMAGCGIATHGSVDNVLLTLHRADGSTVDVRKSGRAFFDEQGEFAGGFEVLVPARSAAAPLRTMSHEPGEPFHGLVSRDASMESVFRTIRSVAGTDVCVLIGGESGTGKELVARALHAESPRADKPFVAVNCASFSPTLLESELFGHVRGAFTGAISDRPGLLRSVDGGTLFLDEVAELPLELQAKLLRVVERSCFVPVGGNKTICVDVRLIAATHRSLRREVKAGRFREDLMYRLRVVPIGLPPLRERRSDLPLLLWHFIEQRNLEGGRHVRTVAPEAMRAMLDHHWPGNVRELQNAVAFAFAIGSGEVLALEDLPVELREDGEPLSARMPGAAVYSEEERIRSALAACGGHVGKAAELLQVSRATLWRKRRRYGL